MYLPDPIERAEGAAERWADDNIEGDVMTCCCGKKCKLEDAETVSDNPYAIPVCPDCFEERYDSQVEKRSEGRKN